MRRGRTVVSAVLVAMWVVPTLVATIGHADEGATSAGLIPVSAAPATASALMAPVPAPRQTFTIVIGGDLGLGGSDQPVSADGALRHGVRHNFDAMTRRLSPLLTGDINFANLETVVTDRNDLRPVEKAFNFRSHPFGIRHLVKAGFNVLSTANNHANDYGEAGLRETVRHLGALREVGLQGAPGTGIGRAASLAPADVTVRRVRVRVGAVGIGGGGAVGPAEGRAVMATYGREEDVREAAAQLGAAAGDIRMLSVHYGQEMQVRPAPLDERRLRDLARTHDIDIVAGHHAHVAAGVQEIDGRVIFYGLGNLLHPGMQDMARYGLCRDYGLLARVHFVKEENELKEESGRFVVAAIEAVTLKDMHSAVVARDGEDGRNRIAVLNHLADGLDHTATGATGVRFTPQPDGTGLYCRPGAEAAGGALGALCRAWAPPVRAPDLERRIAASCGGGLIARRDQNGPARSLPAALAAAPVRPAPSTYADARAHAQGYVDR